MNAAVRFVAGLGPRDHTSDAKRELHWLPIEQRITYKLCVLMHAVETGTAPEYISDIVKPVSVLEGRANLYTFSYAGAVRHTTHENPYRFQSFFCSWSNSVEQSSAVYS